MKSIARKHEILQLRPPRPEDGAEVHRLVARCKPLDENSMYCNLLQCSHFAETCCCAEVNGELVGFVSAYCPPGQADTLFIWQVAVSEAARGQGLASRMIQSLLKREHCAHIQFIEATITPSNKASWALFTRLAEAYQTELNHSPMFDRHDHFNDQHDSEECVRIGPILRG